MTKTEGNPLTPEELEEHEKALSAYDNLELEDEEIYTVERQSEKSGLENFDPGFIKKIKRGSNTYLGRIDVEIVYQLTDHTVADTLL